MIFGGSDNSNRVNTTYNFSKNSRVGKSYRLVKHKKTTMQSSPPNRAPVVPREGEQCGFCRQPAHQCRPCKAAPKPRRGYWSDKYNLRVMRDEKLICLRADKTHMIHIMPVKPRKRLLENTGTDLTFEADPETTWGEIQADIARQEQEVKRKHLDEMNDLIRYHKNAEGEYDTMMAIRAKDMKELQNDMEKLRAKNEDKIEKLIIATGVLVTALAFVLGVLSLKAFE